MELLTVATTILTTPDTWDRADGWGDGWWWILRPFFVLLWIVVIAFVVRFIVFRGFGGPRWRGPSGTERARDILAERFARGEISGEEYRSRLDELR